MDCEWISLWCLDTAAAKWCMSRIVCVVEVRNALRRVIIRSGVPLARLYFAVYVASMGVAEALLSMWQIARSELMRLLGNVRAMHAPATFRLRENAVIRCMNGRVVIH